jgi:hypothetical protein
VEYFSRASRQRRVSRWKKEEMIHVRAGEAERAFPFDERDPHAVSQMLAAFVAGGILGGDEDF